MFSPGFSKGTTRSSMTLSGQPLSGWRFDFFFFSLLLPITKCLSSGMLSTSCASFDCPQFPSLGTLSVCHRFCLRGLETLVEGRTNGIELGNLGVGGNHAMGQDLVLGARKKKKSQHAKDVVH